MPRVLSVFLFPAGFLYHILHLFLTVCMGTMHAKHRSSYPPWPWQASSQTMNTVSAAASSASAHTYKHTFIYVYNTVLCVYLYIYIYYVCITYSIHTHTHTHIFENELFPTTTVQHRQQVDAVGCPMHISFGILQTLVCADRFVLDALHPFASLAQRPGWWKVKLIWILVS